MWFYVVNDQISNKLILEKGENSNLRPLSPVDKKVTIAWSLARMTRQRGLQEIQQRGTFSQRLIGSFPLWETRM